MREFSLLTITAVFVEIILLALPAKSRIPVDLIPINVYEGKETSGYGIFQGLSSKPRNESNSSLHDFQGMKKIGTNYYVYAREAVFLFTISRPDFASNTTGDIYYKQKLEWEADDGDVSLCIRKGQEEERCRSYIKLFQEEVRDDVGGAQKRVIICSTNAFNPECKIYNILDSGELVFADKKFDGSHMCPHNSDKNAVSLLSGGNLYTATVGGFTAQDSLMMRSSRTSSQVNLGTPRADRSIFNDPHFMRFADVGKPLNKILIFFTETAIEDPTGRVYSRVGQACKSDRGGNNLLRNQFTSFFKARMNCSVAGKPTFYFDEMSDVTDLVVVNPQYGAGGQKMVFALMNTPKNSVSASAICAFTLNDIESTLTGPFLERRTREPNDQVYWEKQETYPLPHLAKCDRPPSEINDDNLNFVMKHPTMYESVPAWSFVQNNSVSSSPLYTRTSSRNFLTALVVDPAAGASSNYTVFFAGSEDGKLLKILLLDDGTVLEIEERSVFDSDKCTGDRSVRELILDRSTGSVMVAFQNCLIQAPLCPLEATKCKRKCIESRDPYCGWKSGECVYADGRSLGAEQDVARGNVQSLQPCDIVSGNAGTGVIPDPEKEQRTHNGSTPSGEANPIDPTASKPDMASSSVVAVLCVVLFAVGFGVGLLCCFFKAKWCSPKDSEKPEVKIRSKDNKETSDEGNEKRTSQRHPSVSSRNRRHSGDPRASLLLVDQSKRKRTLTENSGKSDEGTAYFSVENHSLLVPEKDPSKAVQHLSTSSSAGAKRRTRSSRPSATSNPDQEEAHDGSERYSSPSSDQQYEDPFPDDPADSSKQKIYEEQPFIPTFIPGRGSNTYVMLPGDRDKTGRGVPARSVSFQDHHLQHPVQRAYSVSHNGMSTIEHGRPNFRGPNRQLSVQLPNGYPAQMYSQPAYAQPMAPITSPGKRFALVQKMQADPNCNPGKSLDSGRMTDFTHSLDRRPKAKRLNYQASLSESYDEHRHPLHQSGPYSPRKRVVSESEKGVRTPMSRPPRHQAITEEEEAFLSHQHAQRRDPKHLKAQLKLDIPPNPHGYVTLQLANGNNSPAVTYTNGYPENGAVRFVNQSNSVSPSRENPPHLTDPAGLRILPQQRSLPDAISNPSSPATDSPYPHFPGQKVRHHSGHVTAPQQFPAQTPDRSSAPMSLASSSHSNGQSHNMHRQRHFSGSGGPLLSSSHSPGDQEMLGAYPIVVNPTSSQIVTPLGYS